MLFKFNNNIEHYQWSRHVNDVCLTLVTVTVLLCSLLFFVPFFTFSQSHSQQPASTMTRTAKRGPENKKRHEASDWDTLKPQTQSQPSRGKQNSKNRDKDRSGAWQKGQHGKSKKPRTGEEELLHTILHREQRRERRREKRANERLSKKVDFQGHSLFYLLPVLCCVTEHGVHLSSICLLHSDIGYMYFI